MLVILYPLSLNEIFILTGEGVPNDFQNYRFYDQRNGYLKHKFRKS